MDQWSAVNHILGLVREDEAVRAVFLKGSLARNDADQYSDVDFYCLVKDDLMDGFLGRRLGYLESYKPIVYWSQSNFVGPQIVAVFSDGLHFDLYAVTEKSLAMTDSIRVLHDPEGLLAGYTQAAQALSPEQVASNVNEFSFALLEFHAAFLRRDLLWACRLASHLSATVAFLYRYIVQREKSQLGFKRLSPHLPQCVRTRFEHALDHSGPTTLPRGVVELVELVEDAISELPTGMAGINMEFFSFMAARIRQLEKPRLD